MKNKVIALSLLITALFVVPTFADTNNYILEKGVNNSTVYDYLLNNNFNIDISDIYTSNQNTTNADITTASKVENNNSNLSVSSYERQVVELVNAERAKNGLSSLTLDSSVSNVARAKSKDMATNNYFSHTSPTYGGAGSMLSQFGIKYTAYGENIASGQKTPQEVVTAWMNSSGHRANILSSDFTKIGVGYAENSSGKAYWTQMFIR